ncbi:MAG TPA: filamentous hemagglutinin N-terminal domain-containing protein, partial [Chlamydiales bacterium]|nr:filamentous hemagglutinin N-terminal domain-containing protein [Chlamydiales bacterium]
MFDRLLYCLIVVASPLLALPSGGEVVQGCATLLTSSDALQINATGQAIIHWNQFNIAPQETVHFLQADRGGILNRVTSGTASEILGRLQANCPIYLINPNGIFIGTNALIDTAGFLASTADLSNEAFWQGAEMPFQNFGEGRIVNLGTIRASQGDVFLIARGIENQGRIEAPNGAVVLATHEVMVRPDTKECVFIRVDETEEAGIHNSGTIQALSVELKTRSPYEKAICHTGVIEAFATVEQNGRIYLVAEEGGAVVDGTLVAEAGEVRVLGQKVRIEECAAIDVSGPSGGTALIGGDYQGSNPEILNAQETLIAPGAQIHADARSDGNGGKVVIWSDEATFYYGKISARGGAFGGDGGFVEVSGKYLDFDGLADTLAPCGRAGELLLDPINITISAAANS